MNVGLIILGGVFIFFGLVFGANGLGGGESKVGNIGGPAWFVLAIFGGVIAYQGVTAADDSVSSTSPEDDEIGESRPDTGDGEAANTGDGDEAASTACEITTRSNARLYEERDQFGLAIGQPGPGPHEVLDIRFEQFNGSPVRWFQIEDDGDLGWLKDNLTIESKTGDCSGTDSN